MLCFVGEILHICANMLQGHNILQAIKQAKRRQKRLKTVSGISRQRLSRIIKGESKVSIGELEMICSAVGLQLLVVKTAEMDKIRQILAILGENEGKVEE